MIRVCAFWLIGQTATTVSEEKKYNPRLTKTKEEFIEIMNNLNLPYPKMIGKDLYVLLLCVHQNILQPDYLDIPLGSFVRSYL